MDNNLPQLFEKQEICKVLRICPSTLDKLIRDGLLPSVKIGRRRFITKDDLEKLLGRLLTIEEDMSDLSKRVGIYKKLETVIQEYTMNQMVSTNEGDNQ